MCHFLPVYHLGIAFLGRVEGQNITHFFLRSKNLLNFLRRVKMFALFWKRVEQFDISGYFSWIEMMNRPGLWDADLTLYIQRCTSQICLITLEHVHGINDIITCLIIGVLVIWVKFLGPCTCRFTHQISLLVSVAKAKVSEWYYIARSSAQLSNDTHAHTYRVKQYAMVDWLVGWLVGWLDFMAYQPL